MSDTFIKKLESIIYDHIEDEQFDVTALSKELGLSRSQVLRKLKAINGKSVNQLIKEIRLKEAARLIQTSDLNASEVAYKVGFSSPSYFNKCFTHEFGQTPGEFKKQNENNIHNPNIAKFNTRKTTSPWAMLTIVIIVVGIGAFFTQQYLLPAKFEEASIAVLPLLDLSENQDREYLAVGITDAITLELSKQKDVRVISRGSAMRYKNENKLYADIARELDVNLLLEGSVLYGTDSIRVVVQLIEPFPKEKHIWANNYHQKTSNILQVVHDISSEIAKEIDIVVQPESNYAAREVNETAFTLYLKAKHLWSMQNTQSLRNALEYINQSIEIDSTFSPAFILLSEIYISLNKIIQNDEEKSKNRANSRSALEKAFTLDPTNPEAFITQALMYAKFDWNWDAMKTMAEKGLSLDPNNADGHILLSNYYLLKGNTRLSLEEALTAKRIDPLNPRTGCLLAERFYQHSDFEKSIISYKEVLELYPNYGFAWDGLGYVYYINDQKEMAIKSWLELHKLMGNDEMIERFQNDTFENAINFWLSKATSGEKPYCSNPSVVAEASMFVNNRALALDYLEKAYTLRNEDLPVMLLMPHFSPLYVEPRFQHLVKATGIQIE